jgi:D-arabinose 5-phosphate isomerase GutQ
MVEISETWLRSRAQTIIQRDADAVRQLAESVDRRWLQVINLLLICEGHVFVTGAGTSHAVAERLAHLLSCSGIPALPISAADAMHGGSGAVTDRDLVYAISKGGHSAEVNGFIEIAKSRGATIVAQTEALDSPLAAMSDAVLLVPKAEGIDPYGMVATGSSLVAAAVGNVLCGLVLEAQGYTREAFGQTHPSGAVGRMFSEEANGDQESRGAE